MSQMLKWQKNEVRWVLSCLALLTLIGAFAPINELLSYERSFFVQGQYWRPFTAWLTQLNIRHWMLNQWGVVVMVLLLPKSISRLDWAGFALVGLCSSLLLATSNYDNYVGLSGVLYGWLIFAALLSPFYSTSIKVVFIGCLSLKVLSENGYLPLPDSNWVGEFIQGQVAHESHLWGLLSGYLALVLRLSALRFLRIPLPRG